MPNYVVQGSDLSSVANAIRSKGETTAQMAFPTGFVSAIEAIPTGGGSDVVLLASGTYTKDGDSAGIDIPVSYSGTPVYWFYYNKTPKEGTNQTVCGFQFPFPVTDQYLTTYGVTEIHNHREWRGANATPSYAWVPGNEVTLSSTTMHSDRPDSNGTHCAGEWYWAIYGKTAT